MTTAYPGALDTLSNPTGGQVQGSTTPTHSGHHANANDAIEAIEAKLGIGSSTASANTVLRGTGTGTTGYGQVANADLAGSIAVSKLAAGGTANRVAGTNDGSTVGMVQVNGGMIPNATIGNAHVSSSDRLGLDKIVAGAANQVLGAPGGVNTWITAPMYPTAEMNRASGTVALTSASWTPITFDTEVADQDTMINIGGNPTRITFTTAGTYLLLASCEISGGTAGGARGVRLLIGGSTQIGCSFIPLPTGGFPAIPMCWGVWAATAGQYVEMGAYTDVGSCVAQSSNQATRMRAFRIGP